MKRLTLVRHAKSSWKHPDLSDFERPLSTRGKRDLSGLAKRLSEQQPSPDLLLHSSALRTTATAERIIQTLDLADEQCLAVPEMYESCYETLLNLIQSQADHFRHIMLVGHNPGLMDLGNYLTGENISHFPTSGVQFIQISVLEWREVAQSCGILLHLDYPKLHQ
ncbi:SixA phosphatase family protein [Nitrincola alkalilacustris]|uniref:SixA phosphatase family protein n=1 Tax=Nitrincola alkalilacustris TaxID=1571224 RepID=UPI00124D6EAD|nr:histidine phosphatase family protein [Nitrincola alkalilacustris]